MAHSIIFPKFLRSVLYSLVAYNTNKNKIMFHLPCDEVSAFMWLAKVWDLEFKFPLLQYLQKFINKLVAFQFLLDVQDTFFLEVITASHIVCYFQLDNYTFRF